MPHKNFAFLPRHFISKRFSPTLDFTNERILPTPIQILLRYKESKIHHGFKLTDYSMLFFHSLLFLSLWAMPTQRNLYLKISRGKNTNNSRLDFILCASHKSHTKQFAACAFKALLFFSSHPMLFVHNCS